MPRPQVSSRLSAPARHCTGSMTTSLLNRGELSRQRRGPWAARRVRHVSSNSVCRWRFIENHAVIIDYAHMSPHRPAPSARPVPPPAPRSRSAPRAHRGRALFAHRSQNGSKAVLDGSSVGNMGIHKFSHCPRFHRPRQTPLAVGGRFFVMPHQSAEAGPRLRALAHKQTFER